VFGGFSAEALHDRLNDGQAKLVITADGGFRKDTAVGLKAQVDKALANNAVPTVANVLKIYYQRLILVLLVRYELLPKFGYFRKLKKYQNALRELWYYGELIFSSLPQ
jgi:acetyl-coenzyme A synthetase (EC 6.2.1.1)